MFFPLCLGIQVVLQNCWTSLNAIKVFLKMWPDYLDNELFLQIMCGMCLLSFEVVTQVEKNRSKLIFHKGFPRITWKLIKVVWFLKCSCIYAVYLTQLLCMSSINQETECPELVLQRTAH